YSWPIELQSLQTTSLHSSTTPTYGRTWDRRAGVWSRTGTCGHASFNGLNRCTKTFARNIRRGCRLGCDSRVAMQCQKNNGGHAEAFFRLTPPGWDVSVRNHMEIDGLIGGRVGSWLLRRLVTPPEKA